MIHVTFVADLEVMLTTGKFAFIVLEFLVTHHTEFKVLKGVGEALFAEDNQ